MATCALILSTGTIWAQNMNVTGKVTDKNGEPVIGAYVLIQGTSTGTSTDIDGAYLIPSAPANGSLVFSSLGFKEVVVAINNRTVVNVVLEEEALFLEEMVVTAFGIKKERKSLGYAVEDLGSNELMRNKTANPISSLSGKIAGVNITQSSGAAGSGAQIILRGGTSGSEGKDNQPLFVVDGVIYDNSSNLVGNSAFDGSYRAATTTSNRIMDMNPEDIENMSILKGPAASALYGSRAANGVVLITTKKGKTVLLKLILTPSSLHPGLRAFPRYKPNSKEVIWKTSTIAVKPIPELYLTTFPTTPGRKIQQHNLR